MKKESNFESLAEAVVQGFCKKNTSLRPAKKAGDDRGCKKSGEGLEIFFAKQSLTLTIRWKTSLTCFSFFIF